MEFIIVLFMAISLILSVLLVIEFKSYNHYRKQMDIYANAATQFVQAFEVMQHTVNFNADISKEVVDRVNAQGKQLIAAMTLLDLHDKALGLRTYQAVQDALDNVILQPKKEE